MSNILLGLYLIILESIILTELPPIAQTAELYVSSRAQFFRVTFVLFPSVMIPRLSNPGDFIVQSLRKYNTGKTYASIIDMMKLNIITVEIKDYNC